MIKQQCTCCTVAWDLPNPAEAQYVVDAVRTEVLRQVGQPPFPPAGRGTNTSVLGSHIYVVPVSLHAWHKVFPMLMTVTVTI
jgi:hypothetical protein